MRGGPVVGGHAVVALDAVSSAHLSDQILEQRVLFSKGFQTIGVERWVLQP